MTAPNQSAISQALARVEGMKTEDVTAGEWASGSSELRFAVYSLAGGRVANNVARADAQRIAGLHNAMPELQALLLQAQADMEAKDAENAAYEERREQYFRWATDEQMTPEERCSVIAYCPSMRDLRDARTALEQKDQPNGE